MAIYDYSAILIYNASSGAYASTTIKNSFVRDYFSGVDPVPGDMTFLIGEGANGSGLYPFLGTASVNGEEYPVFSGGDGTHKVFIRPGGDYSNPPATLVVTAQSFTVCFAPGSRIATPQGDVPVETLQIGDMVCTADGRDVPVRWLGRQTVSTGFGFATRLQPVRIAAGALGQGLPHSDLTVTADHALLVEGILCHAGALVNGRTITRVPLAELGERFTVYHVETEAHELILANGAATETFIDNVSRAAFDNHDAYLALYGDGPGMVALDIPRAVSARQLPQAIKSRLGLGSAMGLELGLDTQAA